MLYNGFFSIGTFRLGFRGAVDRFLSILKSIFLFAFGSLLLSAVSVGCHPGPHARMITNPGPASLFSLLFSLTPRIGAVPCGVQDYPKLDAAVCEPVTVPKIAIHTTTLNQSTAPTLEHTTSFLWPSTLFRYQTLSSSNHSTWLNTTVPSSTSRFQESSSSQDGVSHHCQ